MHWSKNPKLRAEVAAKLSQIHKARGIMPPVDIRATGDKHHNWKGGVIFNNGYKLIKCPDSNHPHQFRGGYVYEHRYVMEQHLGRYLEPAEKVHHRNQNIKDNRIENLVLCSSNSDHFKKFHYGILNDHRRKPGPTCPHCLSENTGSRGKRSWYCHSCHRQFSKNKYKMNE